MSIAAGSGRLARRDQAVLFDPSGTCQRLVQGFDAAVDDDEAFALIKHALVEDHLEHPPLVAVRWGESVDLLVFGNAELATSAPSAPLLSGASSRTWVEHRIEPVVLRASGSVVVTCGAETASGTNLRLGVAACAGFRVDLAPGSADVGTDEPIRTWRPDPVESTADEVPKPHDAITNLDASVGDPSAAPVVLEVEDHSSTHDLVDFTDSVFDVASPAAVESAIEPPSAGTVGEAGSNYFGDYRPTGEHQAPRPATVETDAVAIADEAQLDDTHVDDSQIDDTRAEGPVAAAPRALDCYGWLELADATTAAITAPLVIGRRPEVLPGFESLVVDHAEVSRSHAQIEVVDSLVMITDLGSRNGTWISEPAPGAADGGDRRMGDPVRLEPGEPHVLVNGCVVLLGASDATLGFRSA